MNYGKNNAEIRQGDIVTATVDIPGTATVQVLGTIVGHNDAQQAEDFVAIIQSTTFLISDEFGNRTTPTNGQVFNVGQTQLEPVFLTGVR
jgi:hypothetical protein